MATNEPEQQTNKRPVKVITLQEKLAILKQLEAGRPRREVELKFKCSQSTISRVLAGKEGIKQDAANNVLSKRDNLNSYKELYKALSRWAREMAKSDAVITANLAKLKAEELSLAMGNELKPSPAWLYKWKERENIKFAKRTKEPNVILKEFLDKRGKCKQVKENFKVLELYKEKIKANSPTKKEVKEYRKDESLTGNAGITEDCETKTRTKREYIKRLPILDADGLICRSRKEKTFLTLLQKLEILQRLKNGERRADLIVEYKLSQSAMSQIVTDEEKILKLAAGGQNLQMKRIRGGIFKGGEAELNAWVQQKMDNGEYLTRTQIKDRAKEIANRLKIDFKASTGWLEKWKARMNLDFNENQILQRKKPNYMTTDEEFENSHAELDQFDSFYEQQDNEICSEIKEDEMNNSFCNDMESSDDFRYDTVETDIKQELLSPQQFYMQTIKSESQLPQKVKNPELEEPDIKPFIETPLHMSQSEETCRPAESLHEQVLSWLNRYNVAPVAASELLNVLKLCPQRNGISNAVQQNRNV